MVAPAHPIAAGIPDHIALPREEMYGEPFDVPAPDELVFISWFEGGEVFRSGCCYSRGQGRIFYFRPGHETYPTYHDPAIQRIIANAVAWTAPVDRPPPRPRPFPAAGVVPAYSNLQSLIVRRPLTTISHSVLLLFSVCMQHYILRDEGELWIIFLDIVGLM